MKESVIFGVFETGEEREIVCVREWKKWPVHWISFINVENGQYSGNTSMVKCDLLTRIFVVLRFSFFFYLIRLFGSFLVESIYLPTGISASNGPDSVAIFWIMRCITSVWSVERNMWIKTNNSNKNNKKQIVKIQQRRRPWNAKPSCRIQFQRTIS